MPFLCSQDFQKYSKSVLDILPTAFHHPFKLDSAYHKVTVSIKLGSAFHPHSLTPQNGQNAQQVQILN